MKPIIGLTSLCDYNGKKKLNSLNFSYINAITKNGGVPIIIPNLKALSDIDRYIDMIDGIVLTGGEDISPLLYGEEPIKEVKYISYTRDQIELELFDRAYESKLPILGICRGLQVVNVALGGTLYQDIHKQIPDALGHLSTYRLEGGYHSINILEGTRLYDIFEETTISVNSQHHQSIKALGKDLKISAKADDGVVEAIESTNDSFLLGVQFHPEAMIDEHKEFMGIFDYFIRNIKR